MDESNVMNPDREHSHLSRTSSTADATSSNVQNVVPFAFLEVKCEVVVSTVYFFSLFNEATLPAERT